MLASHEDAMALLDKQGFSCRKIIQVDPDAILYLNGVEKARTCWLHVAKQGRLRCQVEPGFQSEPPLGWHDSRPGES